jgi:prophage regulatory protein
VEISCVSQPYCAPVEASHSYKSDTLIRLPEVVRRTGLSRATLYRLAAKGAFPRQVKLSVSASAWSSRAVDVWIAERLSSA